MVTLQTQTMILLIMMEQDETFDSTVAGKLTPGLFEVPFMRKEHVI